MSIRAENMVKISRVTRVLSEITAKYADFCQLFHTSTTRSSAIADGLRNVLVSTNQKIGQN